jgi:hypothetical protein
MNNNDLDSHTMAVCLPVKTAGLALPDPVVNAQTHLHAIEVTNSDVIQVMRGAAVFILLPPNYHPLGEEKLKDQRDMVNREYLASIEARMPPDLRRTVQ